MSSPANTARKPSDVFREVYETGIWSPLPWNSGSGSDPETEGRQYVNAISTLIKFNRIKHVVDLGCGDGRILAGIAFNCPGVKFVGVDCCEELIRGLDQRLPHHDWIVNEMATKGNIWNLPRLPKCLYLMKDVLHHWETERILFFLDQMVGQFGVVPHNSQFIITQDDKQKSPDEDCPLGGYRALAGRMFPLALYRPEHLLSYQHKSMWQLA